MSAVAARHAVGILGGMGPAAGAEFVRMFVRECTRILIQDGALVCDQAYPEHWLAQLPVPDRSAALADAQAEQPLDALVAGLRQLSTIGVGTVAIACNTAHAWHAVLQAAVPAVRLLNVLDETARELAELSVDRAGLLATQGTYDSGLYARAFARHGITCIVPGETERKTVMDGIYLGVKRGNMALARAAFTGVVERLAGQHGISTIVLGCTEIPIALNEPIADLRLLDPARILARRLAQCAYTRSEAPNATSKTIARLAA